MKKMICEICGSQSMKKENGVFACQDCGTEYSLEEAKKLLVEINDNNPDADKKEKDNVISEAYKSDKNDLLQYLCSWLQLISPFEDTYFWTGQRPNGPITNEYVERIIQSPKLSINDIDDDMFWDATEVEGINFLRIYGGVDLIKQISTALARNSKVSKLLYMMDHEANEEFFWWGGIGAEKRYVYSYERDGSGTWHDFGGYTIHGHPATSTQFLISRTVHNHAFYIFEQYLSPIMKTRKRKDVTNDYDVDGVFDEIKKTIRLFKDRHGELKKYYEDNFDTIIDEYKNIQREISDLNKQFPLPQKYRRSNVIIQLIDCLEDGRAETWKELINLFEMEGNFSRIISKLDSIDARITSISEKLSSINFHLSDISRSISGIYSKINTINMCAKNIMFDTRYTLIRSII